MSWETRKLLTNLVLLGVLGFGVYKYIAWEREQSGAEDLDPYASECRAKRAEILEACQPACAEKKKRLGALHDVAQEEDPDCLESCAQERFGGLPQCQRH